MNKPKSTLLTTKEAADYLRVSVSFLRRDRDSNNPEIVITKFGSAIRYDVEDLDNYKNAKKMLPPG